MVIKHLFDFSTVEETDLQNIIDLDKTSFPWPWSDSSWIEYFASNQHFFMSLIHEEQTASRVFGLTLFQIVDPLDPAHLLKIVIDPSYRGQGHGRKLLSSSMEVLEAKGYQEFFLEVAEGNRSAISLYNDLGFTQAGKKEGFYSNGETAVLMAHSVVKD